MTRQEEVMEMGAWYIDEHETGGVHVLEIGGGAKGSPGLIAVFEMQEHAEFACRARNAALRAGALDADGGDWGAACRRMARIWRES